MISLQRRACGRKVALGVGVAAVALVATSPAAAADAPPQDAAKPAPQPQPPEAAGSDSTAPQGGDIVVTAQKRSERLVNVPVPVSVVSTSALASNNKTQLRDFFSTVPGLNDAPALRSNQVLSVRGLNTGIGGNPTVGVTIDDVPFGASTNAAGGTLVPDLDPGDLDRIEVLRGPQGTLYGASSIGGLIKYVTRDPTTDAVSGQFQAGLSGVKNGAEAGYNLRGSVNVPATSDLAVRVSGFYRQDPGYVDNVLTGENGINETHVYGGRGVLLWNPATDFSVRLTALYQHAKADGASDTQASPGLSPLQQDYAKGVGGYNREVQAYSLTLKKDLGSVNVTSLTGYNIIHESDSLDLTYAFAGFFQPKFGVTGVPSFNLIRTRKVTEELRISQDTQSLSWVLGGFYTHEWQFFGQTLLATNVQTGSSAGTILDSRSPGSYNEYAAFGDLTYRFSDKFDVQVGARESFIRISNSSYQAGPYLTDLLGASSPSITPEVEAKSNAFTFLVTPRLKIGQDFMAYARVASGYRAGGTNIGAGVPRQYEPDKTYNYELGLKGEFFDRRVLIDASAYYIDWKGVQLNLTTPQFAGYIANAGAARSRGIEVSVEGKPTQNLSISGWVTYGDAELTRDIPANASVVGRSGDRLPNSTRVSAHGAIQHSFPIASDAKGTIGAEISYVGDRKGEFTNASTNRQDLPAYVKVDLHAGADFGSWSLNAYINNLFDRRALLSGGPGNFPPGFYYIQPRTIGLTVMRKF